MAKQKIAVLGCGVIAELGDLLAILYTNGLSLHGVCHLGACEKYES